MPIADLDHVALPTQRPNEMIDFYRALGFGVEGEASWRSGTARHFSFTLGRTKLNVHPPETWTDRSVTLRAPSAVPGCADLCFRFEGTTQEAEASLVGAGAAIVCGPVRRTGGAGSGTSVYARDPDQNLIELIVYAAIRSCGEETAGRTD